ncbi:hypothetical protein HanIR_Chr02g0058651 [Helianthus annuus]|nr:hypothetical protein HanIR_Chr02g0058651 [Helianthus annuus]
MLTPLRLCDHFPHTRAFGSALVHSWKPLGLIFTRYEIILATKIQISLKY